VPATLARVVMTALILIALGSRPLAPASAAGTLTVNSAIDVIDAAPGDGVCEILDNTGICTLRAAVMEANAAAGKDTILLPSGTYTLTLLGDDNNAHAGDLDLTDDLTLQGAGQASTIIAGDVISDRVIHVSAADVWISGVTIRGGDADTGSGGGIFSGGNLTVTASTVRENHSGYGGGIYSGGVGRHVVLNDTTLISNTTFFGGGLMMYSGQAWLTRTVIRGNTATQRGGGLHLFSEAEVWVDDSELVTNTSQFGGGVAVSGGLVTITGSTLRGNRASLDGGGLYNEDHVVLVNSTISLNDADGWGGGLYNLTASVSSLYNVTVAYNRADDDADAVGRGGGVAVAGGTVMIRNTLIGNNFNTQPFSTPVADDCSGILNSSGFNLVETVSNCLITNNATGNITGQDPHLGPLRVYQTGTPTHALLPGSPAIDAGSFNGCYGDNQPLATDQRGLSRHADGDHDGQTVCDIGAFELQLLLYVPLVRR
jgi:hypothetical protein